MSYSTDDIAKAGRTTLRGARLWDMHGLFGTVERDGNGARAFTAEHVTRAGLIGAAQMAGMSLAEIKTSTDIQIFSNVLEASHFMIEAVRPVGGFDL